MSVTIWKYIGIIFLSLDMVWIMFYYYYATVKIYNFKEKNNAIRQKKKVIKRSTVRKKRICESEEYQYLGHLWIRKRRGEYYLTIPQEMIERSVTTRYKIVSQSMLHKFRKGKKIHVNFADKYHVDVKLSAEMTAKNYIATSHQL